MAAHQDGPQPSGAMLDTFVIAYPEATRASPANHEVIATLVESWSLAQRTDAVLLVGSLRWLRSS